MYAGFRLGPTIGIHAAYQKRGRFYARLFTRARTDQFNLVFARLGPTHIHAHKHLRPVLAFRATGAGMNFDVAVVAVGFTRQKRFHLALLRLAPQTRQRRFRLRYDGRIFLGLAQLNQFNIVVQLLLKPLEGRD